MEVRGSELSSVADGDTSNTDASLERSRRNTKDWWLENFGIYVDASGRLEAMGGVSIPKWEVWEMKDGKKMPSISYEPRLAKIWELLQEVVNAQ